ncbi:MAG: hypothetical protein ABI459_10210 [Deltaproteobacteria bacterium]
MLDICLVQFLPSGFEVNARQIVVLTNSAASPLAGLAKVALVIFSDVARLFQPISPAIALVQTLVTELAAN